MSDDAREALEELVTSAGWRQFRSFVEREWGPGGRAFIDATTKAADQNADRDAMAYLRQIIVAQREIQKLMTWPEEQLKTLREPELVAMEANFSRRGGL